MATDWYCPNCGNVDTPKRRWSPLAHVHVWGVALVGIFVAPPLLWYWPVALLLTLLFGRRRTCRECGYRHIVRAGAYRITD